MDEATAILVICSMLGGEPEKSLSYQINTGPHSVRIDCLTDTYAIEVGLDKRSSLDSAQQAEFAAWLTGKKPMVVLVDSDGVEGSIEYRVKTACRRFGVGYRTYSDEYLLRWQMTQPARDAQEHIFDLYGK